MHSSILYLAAIVFCCLIQTLGTQANYATETPQKRFEYKYSFKGPYLAQKDGTVPFWEYSGNAIASEEMVRITPSLRSKKGLIWTKAPTAFEWWEVELVFRVSGKGRIGADGLAFWYTNQKYNEGPVFGSSDHWNGLSLFFDSFDNDNKGNNPYVMAMLNDGSKSYDHNSDGINQQLAGCLRDFRNKPFPVRVKVEYYHNILTVLFHSGNTNNEQDYELCLRAENVFLPQYGYFGISAATGGLADDHDVLKFLTYSLMPQSQTNAASGLSDSDKDRFNREYEQHKAKLEKQREEYYKAHPDEARKMELESDKAAETEFDYSVRELQQIFMGQSEVFESVKQMHRKLDEVIGRQERALSLISSIQSGTNVGVQTGGALPLNRQEVESILAGQREILHNSRELKTIVQHNTANSGATGSQDHNNQQLALLQQLLSEVRENMNVVRREFGSLTTRIASPQTAPCPANSNCISMLGVAIIMFIHLSLLMLYMFYQNSREVQSKKFY